MQIVKDQLGQVLRPQEISDYTGLDVKTVRKYYRELGGIRVGSRILFFEKEFIDAIQTRIKLDRPDSEEWAETGESVPDEETSSAVGSGDAAKARKRLEKEDRHGLFG
jgi:hypothetical protein